MQGIKCHTLGPRDGSDGEVSDTAPVRIRSTLEAGTVERICRFLTRWLADPALSLGPDQGETLSQKLKWTLSAKLASRPAARGHEI